jgi:hypothetical protein
VALAFLGAPPAARAAAPAPDIGAEIASFEDEEMLVEKGQRYIAKLVRDGKYAHAQEVLEYLRLRVDGKRFQILTVGESVVLGALSEDFGFLTLFRQGPMLRHHDGKVAFGWDAVNDLWDDLGDRFEDAREVVRRTPRLGRENKLFVDLLLSDLAANRGRPFPDGPDAEAVERRAQAFLAEFPATPYRAFVRAQLTPRFRPALGSFDLQVYAAGAAADAATAAEFPLGPGLGLSVGVSLLHVHLGLSLTTVDARVARGFMMGNTAWNPGEDAQWVGVGGALGYRLWWGRHALLPELGIMGQQIAKHSDDPDRHPDISFASAYAGLTYDFNLWASRAGRMNPQDRGLHLAARVAVLKAFVRRSAEPRIAPRVLLFQLGVMYESRVLERILEE